MPVSNLIDFANCKDCPLNGQSPKVMGFGSMNPDIMFVGEAPGKTEIKVGRPFVGNSGKLLRQIISQLGIDINNCYFTNTVM